MDALTKAEQEDARGRIDAKELKLLTEHDLESGRREAAQAAGADAQPVEQRGFPDLQMLKDTRIDGLQHKVTAWRARGLRARGLRAGGGPRARCQRGGPSGGCATELAKGAACRR